MTDEWEKWSRLEQQVLPFDFWKEEDQARIKDEEKKEIELQKKIAGLPFFPTPANDNQRFLNFQYQYRHGDNEALTKMYELGFRISMKFINAIARNNHHVRTMDWEQKEIKARDAASYLVEQYITREDFFITKNAPGYLFLRVEKELFYQRKIDKVVDFVDLSLFFKEGENDEEIE